MYLQASRHKLLERPDTWNVMFLDFDHQHFVDHLKMPSVSTILPDSSMCCSFVHEPVDSVKCTCHEDIQVFSIWGIDGHPI